MNTDTYDCPECGADWRAEPIREESRKYYGTKTHFSRLIGIYSTARDMTVEWMCPDCQHRWPREGSGGAGQLRTTEVARG